MRLTSKGRYAVRAMLDLTAHSKGNPVRLQEISTRQNISLHYLEQLFRKLRNGRAVKSVRGPGGGYVLGRAMDEISIKDVLDCVGENINPAKDIKANVAVATMVAEGTPVPHGEGMAQTPEFDQTKSYFENLGVIMQEYLATTSLGDLTRKARGTEVTNEFGGDTNNAQSNSYTSAIRPTIGEINQ
ncbi:MAG: Rrf2 family transcriptional regulator [Bacteriovoracaceae bacterium]|jgi:Rrf2 family transcriptional regulator, iron-sulfur cluster assembly transcription factor|nr:Rrf2 family transcriptional regulator [Bacteriovoracaceae bacterium]